jgi:uncharacterized protein (TIGR01777 family)
MPKIAITGSTGLLGNALINELKSQGHQILRISRKQGNSPWWEPESKRSDLTALENCDAIVHLAGAPIAQFPLTKSKREQIYNSRVQATAYLIETLTKLNNPPKIFISASAIGGYGPNADGVTEETELSTDGFLAKVVRDWEAESQKANLFAQREIRLRTGHVFSKTGGFLKYQLIPYKTHLSVLFGNGSSYISWIHIKDWVNAVKLILQSNNLTGPVNLVSPNPVTATELANVLTQYFPVLTTVKLPTALLKFALGQITAREILLASQKVMPKVLLNCNYQYQFPTAQSALKDLFGKDIS